MKPLVEYKLKKSGFYEEFYPHGNSEIHHITQANAITLMSRFEEKALQYKNELGDQYHIVFKEIKSAYESAVVTQKGLKGSVKLNIPDFEVKKEEFFDQMYCNAPYHSSLLLQNPPKKCLPFSMKPYSKYANTKPTTKAKNHWTNKYHPTIP